MNGQKSGISQILRGMAEKRRKRGIIPPKAEWSACVECTVLLAPIHTIHIHTVIYNDSIIVVVVIIVTTSATIINIVSCDYHHHNQLYSVVDYVNYTVSQKNVLTLKRYSSKLCGSILMIFGSYMQNTP